MTPDQEQQLLHQAMEPLGEILDPLDTLVRGEKGALIMIPVFGLMFGAVIAFESPTHIMYIPILFIIMAIFFYISLKHYRRLKALYHKIEDWPYTSVEALSEAHAAVTSFASRIRHYQYGTTLIAFFSLFQLLFRESTLSLLRELFGLKNDTGNWLVMLILLLLLIPLHFLGKRQHQKRINKNYHEPLVRLQAIINRFERNGPSPV
ncbi:MAG: hypothetical protein LRY55_00495 [Leadbetterella sp.]|nr:hypothetical protein [Leadbetterella sp.]